MNVKMLLGILKNNILSVLCAVVAIAAIIGLWPASNYKTQLQSKVKASEQMVASMQGLLTKPRSQPVVELEATSSAPLDRFPSAPVIEAGNKAKAKMATESKQIASEAVRINKHNPLVAGVLPEPKQAARIIDFRTAYLRMFERDLPNKLRASRPPTPKELDDAAKELWDKKYKDQVYKQPNGSSNEQDLRTQWTTEVQTTLPDQLRLQKAESYQMYMEPDALVPNPGITPMSQPTADQIFSAQMTLWVTEDVVNAIAKLNAGSKNVESSPVKHLVKLEVPPTLVTAGQPAAGGEGGTAAPVAVSATGRVSNSMYDVLTFHLVVNVESDDVEPFLLELTRDRFVTVTEMEVTPIDAAEQKAAGFIYGNKPIVQLNLQCEDLLLRQWTKPLMPDIVKKILQVDAPAPVAPPAEGGEAPQP